MHDDCGTFSPEVSYDTHENGISTGDGEQGTVYPAEADPRSTGKVWFNVCAAVRRGTQLKCSRCEKFGATLGCSITACKVRWEGDVCGGNAAS